MLIYEGPYNVSFRYQLNDPYYPFRSGRLSLYEFRYFVMKFNTDNISRFLIMYDRNEKLNLQSNDWKLFGLIDLVAGGFFLWQKFVIDLRMSLNCH